MKTKTPRRHADLIHAWADGEIIQAKKRDQPDPWKDLECPGWDMEHYYDFRIKPAPPTLGEIARDAYNASMDYFAWEAVGAKIKSAIESGEYSE